MSRWSRPLLATLAVCALAVAPTAHADGATGRYAGAGVNVIRNNDGTIVDTGVVVCDGGDQVGAGGVCLPFGGGDAIHVVDDAQGEDVAFQVCVDNNGDGFCTSNDPDPVCPDVMSFSHDDAGNFHNPVGPVPTGFTAGCPGGPWRGYVVLMCQGTHSAGASAHAHPATSGTATVTSGGEGLGTFCNAPQLASKPYRVSNAPNQTCGMSAQQDPSGEPGTMTGEVHAGPWHRANAVVSIECWLQTRPEPESTSRLLGVTSAPAPAVAVLSPTFVSYVSYPSDTLYLCTKVRWTDASGTGSFYVDMQPGGDVECALVIEVGSGTSRSHLVPQTVVP